MEATNKDKRKYHERKTDFKTEKEYWEMTHCSDCGSQLNELKQCDTCLACWSVELREF